MAENSNISSNGGEVSEQQLMDYLKGTLPADKLHELELQMADSEFVNDAVEGLQGFSRNQKLEEHVAQLNKHLQEQLTLRKHKKEKRRIKDMQWPLVAVVLILLLCLLGYVIVKMLRP